MIICMKVDVTKELYDNMYETAFTGSNYRSWTNDRGYVDGKHCGMLYQVSTPIKAVDPQVSETQPTCPSTEVCFSVLYTHYSVCNIQLYVL